MKVVAFKRFGRNMGRLETAAAFYAIALGFRPVGEVAADTALAAMLGVARVRRLRMRLGAQEIELSECFPAGAIYPARAAANDLCFHHIAVVTPDIAASYRLALAQGAVPISKGGPRKLPESSGGVMAWKFRDPDGHPLEFLQFPKESAPGFDHIAISVADVAKSVAFYEGLGLAKGAVTLNSGEAQDALDGLTGAVADVVALQPPQARPHVELLHYSAPERGWRREVAPADIAADRMVFAGSGAAFLRDPDGHYIVIEEKT
jgi:catechol 2,3-dioxygenase-like lactoylglutathione lyase family enzyme